MKLLIPLMVVIASIWLGYEFWRLLWQPFPPGAYDLGLRYQEVHQWFSGLPVYSEFESAAYFPASYVLLWPFLGWLEFTAARWLWAWTTLVSLVGLSSLASRESGAHASSERIFMILVPLSMYATGAAIGNGQLIVLLLPILLTGLLLLCRGSGRWREDLVGSALVLVSLTKPTLSLPFLWIVLFVPGRLRPLLLVLGGYLLLTLFGLSFQKGDPLVLLRDCIDLGRDIAAKKGYADLHIGLIALGLGRWIFAGSLVVGALLGIWIYRHREADLWAVLGITAFAARFWTYHRWYDDLLILVPLIALFRFAHGSTLTRPTRVVAGTLFALTFLSLLAPGGLYLFLEPFRTLYVAVQMTIWATAFVFLFTQARSLA
jgi:hypothetical protein